MFIVIIMYWLISNLLQWISLICPGALFTSPYHIRYNKTHAEFYEGTTPVRIRIRICVASRYDINHEYICAACILHKTPLNIFVNNTVCSYVLR